MEILTIGPGQTRKIGNILGKEILKSSLGSEGVVLALVGDLGGGKTTFLQGLAKGLGVREKILSPTFVIMKRFEIKNRRSLSRTGGFRNFYHLDCYRVEKQKEILDMGFKKIIANKNNIVAMEWADKIKKIVPKKATWITFKFADKNKRKIVIK